MLRPAVPRPRRPARPGRLLVALALVAGLLGGGWLWLRDSSLVAVEDVEVTGLSGPQAQTIRSALRVAARDLTTLHVDEAVLRAAAAPFPAVESLSVEVDVPHGLTIRVVQRHPVATLTPASGEAVPVAGDGTLLRGAAEADAPELRVKLAPTGDRVEDARTLSTLAMLAAAPGPLRPKLASAFTGPGGLTLRLREGPTVSFGDRDRLRAKWASLSTVLASGQARGATSIDVRVPERPAAAGLEQRAAQIGASSDG